MHKSTLWLIFLVMIVTLGSAFSIHNKRQFTFDNTHIEAGKEMILQPNTTIDSTLKINTDNSDNLQTTETLDKETLKTAISIPIQKNKEQLQIEIIKAKRDKNLSTVVSLYEEILELEPQTEVNFFREYFIIQINQLKNYSVAIATAQRIVQNHSQDALAYNFLGWSYLQTIDTYSLAIKNLLKAKKLDTNQQLPEIYLNLGDYYSQTSEIILAQDNYNKAIEIEQNNQGIISQLARLWLEKIALSKTTIKR